MSSVLDFVIFYRSFLFLAWAFYCALMMLFCFFICQMKVDILGSVSVGSMFCFVGGFCASMLVLRQLSTALSLKMSSTVTDFAIEELIGLASFVDMAPPVPMANGIYMASFFGISRVLISFDNLRTAVSCDIHTHAHARPRAGLVICSAVADNLDSLILIPKSCSASGAQMRVPLLAAGCSPGSMQTPP